jgi:hypothetical protein
MSPASSGSKVSQARNQSEPSCKQSFVSSTMKIEATCSSETPVEFQRTTRRYYQEDRTLHNHRCGESHILHCKCSQMCFQTCLHKQMTSATILLQSYEFSPNFISSVWYDLWLTFTFIWCFRRVSNCLERCFVHISAHKSVNDCWNCWACLLYRLK